MYSKAGMKDVTSGESGLERVDSGLLNQPVCRSLGIYLAFSGGSCMNTIVHTFGMDSKRP